MSVRASCTSPEDGVNTGTAHDGCFAAVARTRFSHAVKKLLWEKAAFAHKGNRTRMTEKTRRIMLTSIQRLDPWTDEEERVETVALKPRACAAVKRQRERNAKWSQGAQHRSALWKLDRKRHGVCRGVVFRPSRCLQHIPVPVGMEECFHSSLTRCSSTM